MGPPLILFRQHDKWGPPDVENTHISRYVRDFGGTIHLVSPGIPASPIYGTVNCSINFLSENHPELSCI